jgi:peptidoglycan/LPS O-acetylase OafA/YrhL
LTTLLESTKGNKHIPALDGVRGLAAVTVFILHYGVDEQSYSLPSPLIGQAIHLGWSGVSLFFVLSGFLITGILWDGFDREHWWANFYIRRSLRIFPLYYLAIFLALIASFTISAGQHDAKSLLIYAFYLQDIPSLTLHMVSVKHIFMGHFWSLAVEEQFYLIWPFVLFAVYRKRPKSAQGLCVIVWFLSLSFRIAVVALHLRVEWAMLFLLGRAGELAAGAFLALLIRQPGAQPEQRDPLRAIPWCLGGASILLALIIYYTQSTLLEKPWMASAGLSLFSVFYMCIVALCLKKGPLQHFFENSLLRWLGKISYGIYVWHLMLRSLFRGIVAHIAPHASRNTALILVFVVAAVGTLLLASLSFYFYESAFLRLKDKFAIIGAPRLTTVS